MSALSPEEQAEELQRIGREALAAEYARGVAEERARWIDKCNELSATLETLATQRGPTSESEGIRVAVRAVSRVLFP